MKKIIMMVVVIGLIAGATGTAKAEGGSIAVIRQGLLGAGTGAVATAMSGAKGDDIWKGALVGMGVNVVGGALLDIITTPSGQRQTVYVNQRRARSVYVQPQQQVVIVESVDRNNLRRQAHKRIYDAEYKRGVKEGYEYGYQYGYSDGYNNALRDVGHSYR
jgi:hypothetical protein